MAIESIVQHLDEQIRRLQEARRLLTGSDGTQHHLSIDAKHKRGSRELSAEAKARIASAQRARWARQKSMGSPTQTPAASESVPPRSTRRIGAAAPARIAAAQKPSRLRTRGQKKAA